MENIKKIPKLPAYEKLKFYKDICEIRRIIHSITERFSKNRMRLVSQMRDAARSAKQNIREGYKRGGVKEFIRYIKISQGSLEELSGDCNDCYEDGLISDSENEVLQKLFQSAGYMSTRYLESLYKMEREGTWKEPGVNRRIYDK